MTDITDTEQQRTPPAGLAYLQALQRLGPMATRLDQFGLLRGAWRIGLVQAAAEEGDVAELARRSGLPEERVADVARALEAYGVFDRGAGADRYVLAGDWRPLLLEDPPQDLRAVLDYQLARARLVEAAVTGDQDYWAAADDDRLAYAVGVALDPASANALEVMRWVALADERQHEQFSAGGRYLELGCGTGGALNSLLQLYPRLHAVGVELSPELAAVARRRAEVAGVADRLTLVCGDVVDFSEPESFDYAFWSQFFFPAHARARALQVALRSLRPGGTLRAPLMGEPVTDTEALRTDEGREYAVDRVVHGGWGVPDRSAEELREEIAAAGFVRTAVLDVGYARLVTASKPD